MQGQATTARGRRFRTVAVVGLAGAAAFALLGSRGKGQQPNTARQSVPATTLTVPTPSLQLKFPNGTSVKADENPEAAPPPTAKVELPELSLGECIAIALERQPSLKAVLASQMATLRGQAAVNNIGRVGSAVSPDLPIRKEQASRGVLASAADVQRVHNEVVQDATRLYYTAVFARQQEQIAADVVAQLDLLVKIGEKLVNAPKTDMTKQKLNAMKIGLATARDLLLTAQLGQKKATAALREVMAVSEATFPFRVKDKELPIMAQKKELTKETVLHMALTQRPEMALAAAGVDAFRLEVYAQGKVPFRRTVPTLASASDLHARDLPQPSRGAEYRPGAIAPEMPPQLVGSKYDRVCRAMAYSQRAEAVYEKTQNLITLEAENGYFDFELAGERQAIFKLKSDQGKELMDWVQANIDNQTVPKDVLVTSYVMAAKAQSDYVDSVFQYLLALAALERITAGGVKPAFPGR